MPVSGEKGSSDSVLPWLETRPNCIICSPAGRSFGGTPRIGERPQHAGDVLEHGCPLPALIKWTRGFAFEVDNRPILIRGSQCLAEVVIAMDANATSLRFVSVPIDSRG